MLCHCRADRRSCDEPATVVSANKTCHGRHGVAKFLLSSEFGTEFQREDPHAWRWRCEVFISVLVTSRGNSEVKRRQEGGSDVGTKETDDKNEIRARFSKLLKKILGRS